MNNKGFTLIELLATIVILSLVLGISVSSVTGAIKQSRVRSERLFVEKLGKSIDDYIDLNGTKWHQVGDGYLFSKKNNIGNSTYEVVCYLLKKSDGESIKIMDLVHEGLIDDAKFINPKNKKKCFDEDYNPEIKVYKDSDYVYYYSVNLSSNQCDLSEDVLQINTLPDAVKSQVGE